MLSFLDLSWEYEFYKSNRIKFIHLWNDFSVDVTTTMWAGKYNNNQYHIKSNHVIKKLS